METNSYFGGSSPSRKAHIGQQSATQNRHGGTIWRRNVRVGFLAWLFVFTATATARFVARGTSPVSPTPLSVGGGCIVRLNTLGDFWSTLQHSVGTFWYWICGTGRTGHGLSVGFSPVPWWFWKRVGLGPEWSQVSCECWRVSVEDACDRGWTLNWSGYTVHRVVVRWNL